ncbi:GDSL-type esterase/lipase family protein [Nocardioides sp. YIM 152315]|uniref:SGNH/GDSL hydrolase family protein n=1 Tax=Nocardioides sp. YIM 152315 TaxID=3031760 RepID=UPI0023DAA335|nr:GDSL-type esterase/lipase family protein [Nocardioides sp. YIM 152315]MDF1605403.1 GDSL-type esterase/lipase family protein [Nocardioides sp. YIM 152315]
MRPVGLRRVLLTSLAVVLLLALVPSANAAGHRVEWPRKYTKAHPIRVMYVGDSMTHGHPGSATYRYWMWREFRQQRVPARFVGPRTDLRSTYPHRDLAPGEYNYEHTDHGFAHQEAHAAQGGSRFAYHLPRIAGEVRTYRPDVVVLELGFNDATTRGAWRIARDTATLLKRIWSVEPDTRVIVGEIPSSGREQGVNIKASRKNARTAYANEVIARKIGRDRRVAIAHLRTSAAHPWDPQLYTFDNVHPNPTGETLFAESFSLAFAELGVFRRPVHVFHQEDWTPQFSTEVSGGTGLAVANLLRVRQLTYATKAKVRVWTAPAGGTLVKESRWSKDDYLAVRLDPGTYWIEPIAARRELVSAPGTRAAVVVS